MCAETFNCSFPFCCVDLTNVFAVSCVLCLISSVKAVKLTSVKAQLPYDYYSLPFCKPEKVEYKSENLGMFSVLFLNQFV